MYIFVTIIIIVIVLFLFIKKNKKETINPNSISTINHFGDNKNVYISNVIVNSVIDMWQATTVTFCGNSLSEKEESVRLKIKLYGCDKTGSKKAVIAEKKFDHTFNKTSENIVITFSKSRSFYEKICVEISGGSETISSINNAIIKSLE